MSRSVYRYEQSKADDTEVRNKLKAVAHKRQKYGYRMLHEMLRKKGMKVNHKKIYRLYCEEGLQLRRKKKVKKVVRERVPMPVPEAPNKQWQMDFVHDSLGSGRKFRCLTIVDICSRYAPAVEVSHSITGERVVEVLERLRFTRGLPEVITVDNGPEFISHVVAEWVKKHGVILQHIQPGKPMQNAFIESFNGTFRHECLDTHCFLSLKHAREIIQKWREEYNTQRPHSSLKNRTPEDIEVEFFSGKREKKVLTYNWY